MSRNVSLIIRTGIVSDLPTQAVCRLKRQGRNSFHPVLSTSTFHHSDGQLRLQRSLPRHLDFRKKRLYKTSGCVNLIWVRSMGHHDTMSILNIAAAIPMLTLFQMEKVIKMRRTVLVLFCMNSRKNILMQIFLLLLTESASKPYVQ